MPDPNARDLKLIQYLNEAYGKERQLETALQAHIAMTTRASYKKRLQAHLRETKGHAREVKRRIKELGGTAETASVPGPQIATEAVQRATELAQRGAAAATGPLHMLRGTGEQEKLLKNAKTEYQDEAEEIATYTAIEALADAVGDRETARLARSIRREEERMQKFLAGLIPTLTKAVATDEIPAAQRNGGRSRSSSRKRSTAKRSTTRKRSTASRSTKGKSSSSGSRSTAGSTRSTAKRSTARRSSTARSSNGSRAGSSSSSSRSGGRRKTAARS